MGSSGPGNSGESLFNIFVIFSTSLEILQIAVVFRPLLGLQLINLPVLLLVNFVSDDDEGEVVWVLGSALEQEFLFPGFQ